MTYEEAKKYLEDCNQYAGEFTLEPLKEMLRRLGDPQDRLQFVHIAGTNGKGSVLAYVSTVLKEAGYRVGRYISPTIFSYRERIQVNEQYISREDLVRLTERVRETGDQMLAEGLRHPTMFEAETALAFLYFAEQACDLVVLECGMGGRMDATNVIRHTVVAVLASISMDHMGYLGDTLSEIAGNKAGIIKPGCTAVTAKQEPEAERVIRAQAEACGCPVVTASPERVENRERGLFRQTFDYKERKQMEITLSGEHQFENAALALDVIDVLREKGYEIPEEAVRDGFRKAVWTGRFSVVAQEPYFIVDGAHNRDAAEKLAASIRNYLQGKRLVYIMGVLADKEYDAVIEKTVGYASEIITVMTPDNVRALPAEELAEAVAAHNPHVQAARSIEDAVDRAYELAGNDDVILAFGSLSHLGALIRTVQSRTAGETKSSSAGRRQSMTDLLELREQIDRIDREMVRLFEERMDICRQVAEYKIANGKKVLDRGRELEKLDTLGAMAHNEFNRHGVQELFQQIMSMSRKLQYQLLEQEGVSGSLPFTRIDRIDRKHCRVVYQGVEGAYQHQAALKYFGEDVNIFHMESWRGCMEAIKEGMADYAVLPIENSSAGEVNDIYDLLEEYENYIVGEQILEINHALLGVPGAKLSDIRTVYSHPQALMQCSVYLEQQHGWKQESVANTAMAAEKVAADRDRSQAAIGSVAAAEHHGLQVLKMPLNHNRFNSTRFIIVTNRKMYEKDAKKVSICFELPHKSGSLYNILSHIIYNDLNMCKIESRPIPEHNWEYHFFVDFDGNLNDSAVKNAIRGIMEEAVNFKILGNY